MIIKMWQIYEDIVVKDWKRFSYFFILWPKNIILNYLNQLILAFTAAVIIALKGDKFKIVARAKLLANETND